MLLYDSGVSGNCYKVRLLLTQLGLDFERREMSVVDRSDRQEVIGHLNPGLRVPTLVLDDGRPLAESNAIMWFFAEGTEFLPSGRYKRAQVLQWLCFEQYSHEPNVAVLRFWLHYAAQRPGEDAIEEKRAGGRKALEAMEAHLAGCDFFVADRYTIADIALYAYTHVADFDLEAYPAVSDWLARIAAQPDHVPITA
ncbi:MAG: glutathione S-transferase family protein [Solirubrobacteraceae bacterium]